MDKILLVGLGNTGNKYTKTRHNLGIRVVEYGFEKEKAASSQVKEWREDTNAQARVAQVMTTNKRIDCLFPLTNMNDSGKAVAAYIKKEGIPMENIVILHDDLELPFGEVKFKDGGGAAGHNGIRSIHQHLGTQDIARIRLGIGRPPEGIDVHTFVLQKFTPQEETEIEEISERAHEVLSEYLG